MKNTTSSSLKFRRLLVTAILAGLTSVGSYYGVSADDSTAFSVDMPKAIVSVAAMPQEVNAGASVTGDVIKDTMVNALLYQDSAEVAVLQQQAYELAQYRLKDILQHRQNYDKPLAIITDIDMTLLSDSGYHNAMVLDKTTSSSVDEKSYVESHKRTSVHLLPGALEFLRFASRQGVEIFYITNRPAGTQDVAIAELAHFGFPNADTAHVQVRDKDGGWDKQARRDRVLKTHDVVLYLGDQFSDLTSNMEAWNGVQGRLDLLQHPGYHAKLRTEWILLPNAVYGDWQKSVWFGQKDLSLAEKQEYIRHQFDENRYTNPKWETWYQEPASSPTTVEETAGLNTTIADKTATDETVNTDASASTPTVDVATEPTATDTSTDTPEVKTTAPEASTQVQTTDMTPATTDEAIETPAATPAK